MNLKKRILTLSLALVLCLGLFLPVYAEEEAQFGAATSLQTGEYILVLPGVTPTGMSNGAYYMTAETANNPGMLFKAFDEKNPDGATYWKVTRVSATECTIQNPEKGENGYLNITANTLTYGPKQNLKYSFAAGKCKFYAEVGGTAYSIRFTNSTNNESRFHAGSGDSSNLFQLYGMVKPEEYPNVQTSKDADLPKPTTDPLLTVACVSDMHADYGLQSRPPYIRSSVIETLNRMHLEEDADILLVGGDNTSDNGGVSDKGGWTYETFMNVINKYREVTTNATESGRTLWACGNHDFQAGEDEGYDSYAPYEGLMTESCGKPLSIYRQKDDKSLTDQRYPDFLIGAHYNVENFDFIVLNGPYAKHQTYSTGSLRWLSSRLKAIGKNKTVFLLTHYPLTDFRNISTPTYGVQGDVYNNVMALLKNYPNVIYLYGHNHGGSENVYLTDDTYERITFYTEEGQVINNRYAVPTSFISSFMGSMSYYNYHLNSGGLTAEDPEIVQGLMIYVYGDRIVFQMKNYGENKKYSDRILKTWTVMRDVQGSLDGKIPESDGSAEGGTPSVDPGDFTKPDKEETPPSSLLLTKEVLSFINYDPALSIGTLAFDENAPFVKSYGKTVLYHPSITGDMKLDSKTLSSGAEYDALASALNDVVTGFQAYIVGAKKGGDKVTLPGTAKITLGVPEDLPLLEGEKYGIYYVKDGKLHMTDVLVSEDGKTLSFLLPENVPFALSVRATVAGDPVDETPAEPEVEITGIIIAVAGGVVLLAGGAVLAVFLIRLWKKEHGKTEE